MLLNAFSPVTPCLERGAMRWSSFGVGGAVAHLGGALDGCGGTSGACVGAVDRLGGSTDCLLVWIAACGSSEKDAAENTSETCQDNAGVRGSNEGFFRN